MVRGIAISGLNGAGKSSIAHALAKISGYTEMDAEDYYFPEQKTSRQKALEGIYVETNHPDELPFSISKTKDEVQSMLIKDISVSTHFILSGVTMNWSEEILSKIDIAFFIQAPLEIRLQRITSRETKRFGPRTLPGGDMYEQQQRFREIVANRNVREIEQSIYNLHCPVYKLDGTLPVEENVNFILQIINHDSPTMNLRLVNQSENPSSGVFEEKQIAQGRKENEQAAHRQYNIR